MATTITIVTAVFALSLAGAVVLFRFFRSTALVRRKTYQAGGALAGFIIIYGLLFSSAYYVERLNNQQLAEEVEALRERLKNQELTVVSGMVEPDRGPVKIRLVFDDLEPDSSEGRFTFRVPRLVLDNAATALYAVTDDEHVLLDVNCVEDPCDLPESFVYLSGRTTLNDIRIPVKLKRR